MRKHSYYSSIRKTYLYILHFKLKKKKNKRTKGRSQRNIYVGRWNQNIFESKNGKKKKNEPERNIMILKESTGRKEKY